MTPAALITAICIGAAVVFGGCALLLRAAIEPDAPIWRAVTAVTGLTVTLAGVHLIADTAGVLATY